PNLLVTSLNSISGSAFIVYLKTRIASGVASIEASLEQFAALKITEICAGPLTEEIVTQFSIR
ncbi:MAG: hypothetical protein PVG70_07850, partial [Desulfobacterales bacterium]